MDLIEKIEIKSFRSFGNRKKNKTQIINLKDLNIFSGGNDSGKSNILRALNLFFNQNTNLNQFINFNKDFFKPEKEFKDMFIEEEMITIKLYFWNKKNKNKNSENKKSARLPERFWVSRKWIKSSSYNSYNQDSGVFIALQKEKGDEWKNFTDENGNIRPNVRANISKQLTDFLNSIQYHYVPAIKDDTYFSHLYGELQRTLLKESQSEVNKTKNDFEKALQTSTETLMQEFEKVIVNKNLNIEPAFELPDLINLFKTLNVQTRNDIDLKYRGDGIQAKLIPEILYFIALKELNLKQTNVIKGEKVKKYFIWGFEEPENSYEYKNIKILAGRFVDIFSKYAQIFITTHSKEFLSLERNFSAKEKEIINNKKLSQSQKQLKLCNLKLKDKSSEISLYRVWKNTSTHNASQVTRFNDAKNEWENIKTDLGIDNSTIIQDSRLIEKLQIEIQNQKDIILKSNLSLEQKEEIIKDLNAEITNILSKLKSATEKIEEYEKICVYFEDKYIQIYKIAYLKLNDIDFDKNNFEMKFKEYAPFSFFGKDGKTGLQKFLDQSEIAEHDCRKVIGVFDFDDAFSDFNGLNDARWHNIEGTERNGLYRVRKDNKNFCSIILPVPNHRHNYASKTFGNLSKLEIELLFTDEVLKQLNAWGEQSIPCTNPPQKISIFRGNKKKFWEKLFVLDKEAFRSFQPLFDRILELSN